MAGSCAEVGTIAAPDCAFRCFLVEGQLNAHKHRGLGLTHFRRLLSPIAHLIPSMMQFEQVISPSAII